MPSSFESTTTGPGAEARPGAVDVRRRLREHRPHRPPDDERERRERGDRVVGDVSAATATGSVSPASIAARRTTSGGDPGGLRDRVEQQRVERPLPQLAGDQPAAAAAARRRSPPRTARAASAFRAVDRAGPCQPRHLLERGVDPRDGQRRARAPAPAATSATASRARSAAAAADRRGTARRSPTSSGGVRRSRSTSSARLASRDRVVARADDVVARSASSIPASCRPAPTSARAGATRRCRRRRRASGRPRARSGWSRAAGRAADRRAVVEPVVRDELDRAGVVPRAAGVRARPRPAGARPSPRRARAGPGRVLGCQRGQQVVRRPASRIPCSATASGPRPSALGGRRPGSGRSTRRTSLPIPHGQRSSCSLIGPLPVDRVNLAESGGSQRRPGPSAPRVPSRQFAPYVPVRPIVPYGCPCSRSESLVMTAAGDPGRTFSRTTSETDDEHREYRSRSPGSCPYRT